MFRVVKRSRRRGAETKSRLSRALLALTLVFVTTGIIHEPLIQAGVNHGVARITGLHATVGNLSLKPRTGRLNVTELDIHNPRGFQDDLMMEVSRVGLIYSLKNIIPGSGGPVQVSLHIKQATLVRNVNGEWNFSSLNLSPLRVPVKRFIITLKNLTLKDYRENGEIIVKHYKINLRKEYENVRELESIKNDFVTEVVQRGTAHEFLGHADFLYPYLVSPVAKSKRYGIDGLSFVSKAAAKTTTVLKRASRSLFVTLCRTVFSPAPGS